jgi:hypothetical protein
MDKDISKQDISVIAGKILKLLESEGLTMHGAINALNNAWSRVKYADPCLLPFSITDERATCRGFPEFPEFIKQDDPDVSLSVQECPDR